MAQPGRLTRVSHPKEATPMAVPATLSVSIAREGEYHFQNQLAPQSVSEENEHPSEVSKGGRLVPQTSSVIAPGFARRVPTH